MDRFIFPDERQASWEFVKGISVFHPHAYSPVILPRHSVMVERNMCCGYHAH
jgi:hypothetical protein